MYVYCTVVRDVVYFGARMYGDRTVPGRIGNIYNLT